LAPTIAAFLQVICFFYIFMPPVVMSSSIFQGTGKEMSSLTLAILRNMIPMIIFAYILAILLNMGERGVWWGIVAGDIAEGIVAYVWVSI